MMRRRIRTAFWIILACYAALVGRLVYLQGTEGTRLRDEAVRRRTRTIPIAARHGAILDRNGVPMAVSIYSGTVGFDASVLETEGMDAKKIAHINERLTDSIQRVAKILQLPADALTEKVRQAKSEYSAAKADKKPRCFVIQKDIPLEIAQALARENDPEYLRKTGGKDADGKPKKRKEALLGFGVNAGSKRTYPGKASAAQVIGMTDAQGNGVAGIERGGSKWLVGAAGKVVAEVDGRSRQIPDTEISRTPQKDGLDVQTTLDAFIQGIATNEAQTIVDKYHPNGVSIVVLEPETGDILALVSMPNYDPNPDAHSKMPEAAHMERCNSWLYEPGSTLKVLTVAAGLNSGTISEGSRFNCNGSIKVDKHAIHCDWHGGTNKHGYIGAADILRVSCNVGAAQIGLAMGPHKLYDAEKSFGLFDKLPIELPNRMRGRLSFDKREKIYTKAKAARVAFGHSITTTPLHVALAYAAIANGGLLMQPRLVMATKDENGNIKQKFDPKPVRQVISPSVAALVTRMMQGVVADGTGKVAAIAGYTVAGKTGTAHKYTGAGAYVGSFAGFLPSAGAAKPRVVILVAVDEPQGAHYGADVAAPSFQHLAAQLMNHWHVAEDDPDGAQYAEAHRKKQGN